MKKNILFLFFIVFISFLIIPIRVNAEYTKYSDIYDDYKKHLDFSIKNGALIQCYYDVTDVALHNAPDNGIEGEASYDEEIISGIDKFKEWDISGGIKDILSGVISYYTDEIPGKIEEHLDGSVLDLAFDIVDDSDITFAIVYDPSTSEYIFSSRVIYSFSNSTAGKFVQFATSSANPAAPFVSRKIMKIVEDSGHGLVVNSLKKITVPYNEIGYENVFKYSKNSLVTDTNGIEHYYYYLYLSKEAKDSLIKGECPEQVRFAGEYFADDYGKIRFCFQNSNDDSNACPTDDAWKGEMFGKDYYGGNATYKFYDVKDTIKNDDEIEYKARTTVNQANTILNSNAKKLSKIKKPSVTKDVCENYANGATLESSFSALDSSLKNWKTDWKNAFISDPSNISTNDKFLGENFELLLKGASIASNSYVKACSEIGLSEKMMTEIKTRLGSDAYTTVYPIGDDLVGNVFDYLPEGCKSIRESKLGKWLDYAFTAIKIATPILCIVLIGKDIVSAIISQKDENFKTVRNNIIKRLIIGLVIYLLPTIITTILNLAGLEGGTCGIK